MASSGAGATARLLGNASGLLWRSLDRLLREASDPAELNATSGLSGRTGCPTGHASFRCTI
jgi:hypothetical protein